MGPEWVWTCLGHPHGRRGRHRGSINQGGWVWVRCVIGLEVVRAFFGYGHEGRVFRVSFKGWVSVGLGWFEYVMQCVGQTFAMHRFVLFV